MPCNLACKSLDKMAGGGILLPPLCEIVDGGFGDCVWLKITVHLATMKLEFKHIVSVKFIITGGVLYKANTGTY